LNLSSTLRSVKGRRTIFHRTLLGLFVVGLLIYLSPRSPTASASSVRTISGSFQDYFSNYAGVSRYTIDYHYPSEVNVGQNLNLTFTIFVDQLTSLKLYVFDWGAESTLATPSGPPITKEITVNSVNDYLYQGSHWGPETIVIPINSSTFDVAPGESFVAPLSLNWIADVQYDKPYNWHFYENNVSNLGNVTIVNNVQTKAPDVSLFSYVSIGAIAVGVVVVSAWYFLSKKRANIKSESRTNGTNFLQLLI
jgi:hypothetical protein